MNNLGKKNKKISIEIEIKNRIENLSYPVDLIHEIIDKILFKNPSKKSFVNSPTHLPYTNLLHTDREKGNGHTPKKTVELV